MKPDSSTLLLWSVPFRVSSRKVPPDLRSRRFAYSYTGLGVWACREIYFRDWKRKTTEMSTDTKVCMEYPQSRTLFRSHRMWHCQVQHGRLAVFMPRQHGSDSVATAGLAMNLEENKHIFVSWGLLVFVLGRHQKGFFAFSELELWWLYDLFVLVWVLKPACLSANMLVVVWVGSELDPEEVGRKWPF